MKRFVAILVLSGSWCSSFGQDCSAPPSDLISWWQGEGNANDIVGTNNGVLENVTFVSGMVGQAFYFNGSNADVQVPYSTSLQPTNVTVEAWVKLDALASPVAAYPGLQYIVFKKNSRGGNFEGYDLEKNRIDGQDVFRFQVTSSDGFQVPAASTTVAQAGVWYHLAGTYDGTTVKLYVNGELEGSAVAGFALDYGTRPVFIGTTGEGWDGKVQGTVDEVSIYSRALAAGEIAAICSAGSQGKCPPSPPTITAQPGDRIVVVGDTANFSVTVTGAAPLSYQWAWNGTNIDGATNVTLTLTDVQFNQAGTYAVLVTNRYGSALSANAMLTVNPLPTNVPVITGFSPISGMVGTGVTIIGTNFSPVASNNIVYFGAVRAMVVAASETSLTVTVPTGAAFAPITETVNGLVAYASRAFEPTFVGGGSAIGPDSFAPRVDLAVGNGPGLVVIADLDGDGKPDLIVANGYDGTISLYRNICTNGTLDLNSFAPRVDFPMGGVPSGLAAADVDGDGKLDLVVSDNANNRILVYRNVSTSGTLTTNSFASPVALSVGADPRTVQVADLDGDGRPDIICVSVGEDTVSIFRNVGLVGNLTTNSFAPRVTLGTGSQPKDLVVVDLDGDGKPDLAQVNYTPSFVSVFRNISTPGILNSNSFAPRADFAALGEGNSIIAGDVDGDGKADLVVGWAIGSGVAVYRNLSSPGVLDANSLAPAVGFPAPGWVRSVGMGDLNGDGKPDLGFTCEVDSDMGLFQNLSTPGSFTSASLGARVDFGTGWNPQGMVIGDLDGDGRPDIVFGNFYDATVSIYQNVMPFAEAPTITTQPHDALVNAHDNASFNVVAAGTTPLSYQWELNGANMPNATSDNLSITNVKQSNLGSYTVVVTNIFGAVTSSVANLLMYPYIAESFSGAVTYWGQDTTLSVGAWGTGPLSYQWYQDGVALLGATNETLSLGAIQFTNAGLYYVVVNSPLGSVTNAEYEVVVNPASVSLGLFPGVILTGTVGYNYIIQGTTNLGDPNSWTTLTNITLSQPVQIWNDNDTDVTKPDHPRRFYQVLPGQ